MDHTGGSPGCAWHIAVTPGLETFSPETFMQQDTVASIIAGEGAIIKYIALASFVSGGISALAIRYLWVAACQWWATRVERYLSTLEQKTSKLIQEKRFHECICLLERGITYLLSQSQCKGYSSDLCSVKHLLAKVFLLDGRPQDAETLLVDLTRHYERSNCGEKILTEALEDLGRALSMQNGREKEAASVWQRHEMQRTVDGEGEEDLSTLIGSLESLNSSSSSESPAVNRYLSTAFSPMVSPIAMTRKYKVAAKSSVLELLAELKHASPTTDQENEAEEEEDIETTETT